MDESSVEVPHEHRVVKRPTIRIAGQILASRRMLSARAFTPPYGVRCRHPASAGGLDQVFDEIGEGHDAMRAEASMLTRTKLVVAHAAMGHDAPTSQDPNIGNGGDSNSIAVVRNGSCTNGALRT
jgi:hypothetical protein